MYFYEILLDEEFELVRASMPIKDIYFILGLTLCLCDERCKFLGELGKEKPHLWVGDRLCLGGSTKNIFSATASPFDCFQ